MKHRVFAVRDGKVEQFFPPMVFQTPGEAQRWFEDLVNDGKSALWKHPGDFALYELGSYETETGLLTAVMVSLVATGIDVFQVTDLPVREVKHG